jgi:outer membrane lipoprotein-sorting protein
MNRAWTGLGLALALAVTTTGPARAAGLSPDDKALVDRAAAYLEGLNEDKGRFVQTDPHGNVTQGELLLKRPGMIRFQYDPPSRLLVVSDGKTVRVVDPRLKSVNKYALKATPLSIFLADHIRLDKGVVVDQVMRTSYGFQIVAHSPKLHGGTLAMVFADKPMRLMEWTVVDAQGGHTRVQVSDLQPTQGLSDLLFRAGPPENQGSELANPPVAAR